VSEITQSPDETLLAIAVGQLKEARKLELTEAILVRDSFEVAGQFLSQSELERAQEILNHARELELEVWPLTSPQYPILLRETNAPPPVLFARRFTNGCQVPSASIGVVGTRAASIEVCQHASEISEMLATAGLTIISGLALGIDGAAHRGALRTSISCPTIAVLAHGLDRVYPPTHNGLAREILESGGVLLSEYAPYVEPMKHHFLARNRIVAGLSRGVVVIQAGARSGSLVTARFAADYGRDVFVLEMAESDTHKVQGSEALLEQGAIAISSAREVLREYGLLGAEEVRAEAYQWATMSVEAFIEKRRISVGELLKLELEGSVVRLPGNKVRVWSEVERAC
jgi:DNA protecting protein DprA